MLKRKKDIAKQKKKAVEKIMKDIGNEMFKIEGSVKKGTFFPPGRDFAAISVEYMYTIASKRCRCIDKILESELTPSDFGENLLFTHVLKDQMKDELKGEKREKVKRLGWI